MKRVLHLAVATCICLVLISPLWAQSGCVSASAGGGFTNTAFAPQNGTFTATFDSSPSSSLTNEVIGLSQGAQTSIANYPVLVSYSSSGHFVARNGGSYGATNIIPYSPTVSYHFELAVDVATSSYSVFVTPQNGSRMTVASNFAFRSGVTVSALDNVGSDVDTTTGSFSYCNFSVVPAIGADFTISATPPSQTVTAGAGACFTVNIGAVMNFSGSVALSVSGLPAGATAAFNPSSVVGSGTSMLCVTLPSSVPPGSCIILIVTGTSGSLKHSTPITICVNQPIQDFMLTASPTTPVTVVQGNTATFTATVAAINGFTGPVALTVTGVPAGATSNLSPATVNTSGNSTLTITTTTSTATGPATLTITGNGGGFSHSATVQLVVNPSGGGGVTENVLTFGAVGNGSTLDTHAFQAALDSCGSQGTLAAPCTVLVPAPHTYLVGSIAMSSNTILHVESGATIQGSNNAADYPLVTVRWEGRFVSGHRGLIWSNGAQNITIQGGGTIAGGSTVGALRNPRGPVLLEPTNSTNVTVDGMHLTNHNVWTVHPLLDTTVNITNTTINTSGGNSDGIDPDSTTHMLIDQDTINTGDDAIAIKSGRGLEGFNLAKPSADITISNSSMTTGFGCVTLGSEMSGGIDTVTIRNITCGPRAEAAIKFKAPIGRGAYIRNIDAQGVNSLGGFMIRFTLSQGKTDPNPVTGLAGVPQLSNISVTNSTIHGGTLADMVGWTQKPTDGITIENITGTCAHGINIANAVHVTLSSINVTGFTPPLITETNVH